MFKSARFVTRSDGVLIKLFPLKGRNKPVVMDSERIWLTVQFDPRVVKASMLFSNEDVTRSKSTG